jgi:hypothetical protein
MAAVLTGALASVALQKKKKVKEEEEEEEEEEKKKKKKKKKGGGGGEGEGEVIYLAPPVDLYLYRSYNVRFRSNIIES